MTAADLIAALGLPPDTHVDHRVPKKSLVEHGAPTAADKRRINAGVEEVHWLAALKPTTVGVPPLRDSVREYLEIAVLSVILRPSARTSRVVELIHRAIPYPVVLIATHETAVHLSLAHKRWSQGEAGKTVLDGEVVAVSFAAEDSESDFLSAMPVTLQPRGHLYALYQGWIDCVRALAVARITGVFVPSGSINRTLVLRETLDSYEQIQRDLTSLRARAVKERQISRRVELNLEIKRLEAELTALMQKLRLETPHESHRSPVS